MSVMLSWLCDSTLACDECGCHGPQEADHPPHASESAETVSPQADSSASSFKFGVVGDTQGLQFVSQLITDMNAHSPELVVFPGDLVSQGSVASWNQWNNLTKHFIGGPEMRLMVPGNHDLPVGGDTQWQQTFNWLPDSQMVGGVKGIDKMDYFYDHGNTRFISVTTDSQAHGAGGQPAALEWLDKVLKDPTTQSKDHVFVYSHHPITFNNYDRTGGTAGAWWQTMGESGVVDSVFVGHWHQYQPSQPHPHHHTWELIAGTGNSGFSGHEWQNKVGYTIVEVDGARAVARFYSDADGDGHYDDLFDTFVMSAPQPAATGVVGYYGFHDATLNVDAAPAPLGKDNTGEYVGNANTVAGPIHGQALSLDGDGDFAHGGGIGDYNLAVLRDLTLSIHANYDQLGSGNSANTLLSYTANVAGYTDAEEAVNQPYNFRIRDDRRLVLFWEHDNNEKVTFTSTVPADVVSGEWHEYRVTRDATAGAVRFYVDGQPLGDELSFDPQTQLPTGGGQGYLRIGINYDRKDAAKLVGGFDGLLDEVVIWNEVTTAAFQPPVIPCNVPGDLTGDCIIDAKDWMRFREGQHVDMTGMTPAEAEALGDLNGDFRNDYKDFQLFKQAYESRHGDGSFASMTQSVPEPGPTTIASATAAILVLRWRHQQRKSLLRPSQSTEQMEPNGDSGE
ncbi:LamG-like jellyroll fold domain-containing protein [Aeoliella sp.]|uniref:LamG-like jellyroll fold domain-containing protein n=1 Tax=Aeoliella sp. TaxID=2795800 RepID=UPI003CCC1CD6